jgi:hypothetical protein
VTQTNFQDLRQTFKISDNLSTFLILLDLCSPSQIAQDLIPVLRVCVAPAFKVVVAFAEVEDHRFLVGRRGDPPHFALVVGHDDVFVVRQNVDIVNVRNPVDLESSGLVVVVNDGQPFRRIVVVFLIIRIFEKTN